jgi:hypothetical protein
LGLSLEPSRVPRHRCNEHLQPEKLWVCVRSGERRGVTEEKCANCSYWEELPTKTTWN